MALFVTELAPSQTKDLTGACVVSIEIDKDLALELAAALAAYAGITMRGEALLQLLSHNIDY